MAKFTIPEDQPLVENKATDFLKSGTQALLDVDIDEVKANWSNNHDADDYLKSIDDVGKSTVDSLGKLASSLAHDRKIDNKSIFARTRNSLCQFPVYISQSIRVNEAHIISKMFERVYASLMQAILAQQPIATEDDIKNMKFLRKIHTNLKESSEWDVSNMYYTPIDDTDEMLKESVYFEQKINDNITVRFRKAESNDPILEMENRRLMNEPLIGLSYLQEAGDADDHRRVRATNNDDVSTSETRTNKTLSPKDVQDIAWNDADVPESDRKLYNADRNELIDIIMDREKVSESDRKIYNSTHANIEQHMRNLGKDKNLSDDRVREMIDHALRDKKDIDKRINDLLDAEIKHQKDLQNDLDKIVDKWKADVKTGKNKGFLYHRGAFVKQDITTSVSARPKAPKPEEDINKKMLRGSGTQARILKDVEIKKLNGMDAYPIEVAFLMKTKEGYFHEVRFIISVKTVLHLINPKDLSEDLREIVTGKIKSLQKVRYKTGEISFKDYMFNKGTIKKDAAKGIQYNKKWLNTLKRLGEFGKLNGTLWNDPAKYLAKGDVPIPNGTMILSQTDVTTLTAETGIDLSVVANVKRMAKNLFLIAVAIVDGSAGTMKVLYVDSANDWDIQSLASIESEIAKTDNSPIMRELNRMVNR